MKIVWIGVTDETQLGRQRVMDSGHEVVCYEEVDLVAHEQWSDGDVILLEEGADRDLEATLRGCRELRSRSRAPILVWTPRDDEEQIAAITLAGADDLMTWPAGQSWLLRRLLSLVGWLEPAPPRSRFQALVSNMPGAVYRCAIDSDWTCSYISDAVHSITGYPASDILHNNVRSLASVIHPEDRARVERTVKKAIDRGRPFTIEYRMVHADGNVRWVSERGRQVRDEHGATFLDGVFFDVTEVKRMQQQMVVHSQMASVGALAAGVAHEINNPLAIVMSNLDYIGEEIEELADVLGHEAAIRDFLGDTLSALAKTQNGVERVRCIVQDLRTFSDAAEQHIERVDLRRVMEWALQNEQPGIDACATLVCRFEEVSSVWANELGLIQVFSHLLTNAVQALEESGPEANQITVAIRRTLDDKTCVEISDTGGGIADDVMPKIFDPFFSTKPVGQGTGLGLFVCQGVVASMGGEIEVETVLHKGSTFRVILPVTD